MPTMADDVPEIPHDGPEQEREAPADVPPAEKEDDAG